VGERGGEIESESDKGRERRRREGRTAVSQRQQLLAWSTGSRERRCCVAYRGTRWGENKWRTRRKTEIERVRERE
jgi:hypothetical protein